MSTVRVEQLQVGDIILPPERELSLWMRKCCLEEKKLPLAALNLTVRSIREGTPDKRGRWVIVTCDQTPEWGNRYPFKFKARPATEWPLIRP